MIIHYKLIENERLGDAPFCGALLSAVDCKFNCKKCFNQKIKELPTLTSDSVEIIKQIKANTFNKGIIFAGLEWTMQLNEAIVLADEARANGLLTMLYTGNIQLDKSIMEHFDYTKVGRYDDDNRTVNHIEYGVTLASSNQHIYRKGVDY